MDPRGESPDFIVVCGYQLKARGIRLLAMWNAWGKAGDVSTVQFDRVAVPELSVADMFDDAFTGIARDGAGAVEVVVRLLKALESLAVAEGVRCATTRCGTPVSRWFAPRMH